ncbi:MAG TPA: hypothetical protein VF503_12265 [Sphingobium sp.]|uniref:hypothetical protein n=1 Tax=Sphingobium sp. TaxID=1912891 RepID=UPI002ECFBAA9
MTEEKYTVQEIDALRQVCKTKFLFGSYRGPTGGGTSRSYGQGELVASVEQMVRTHIMAGHWAADLLATEPEQPLSTEVWTLENDGRSDSKPTGVMENDQDKAWHPSNDGHSSIFLAPSEQEYNQLLIDEPLPKAPDGIEFYHDTSGSIRHRILPLKAAYADGRQWRLIGIG